MSPADPPHDPRGDLGGDDDAHAQGQKREPGLQRAVAEDVLQDLREEEEDGDGHGARDRAEGVRARAVAVGKQPEGHQRLPAPKLDEQKEHQEQGAGAQGQNGQVVAPGVGRRRERP